MRESGILMHITSLPGPYGIGTMGENAYQFVDFLEKCGQSYWQILPLSPTGYGDSPYQSFSAFAGNHYLIDLDLLAGRGLLTKDDLDGFYWGSNDSRVDFGAMYSNRLNILRIAYEHFLESPDPEFKTFVLENSDWLDDYALFMSLKQQFKGADWLNWPLSLMMHLPDALDSFRKELADQIGFQQFLQYEFYQQWNRLRRYANDKGIRIIGDVPIYVPLDSCDVWSNSHLFQLNQSRRPQMVAGCPPDSFSADGQLWGNPLYNWDMMKQTGYAWWIRRLKAASRMYDVVRFDHFRGFESYWSIPACDDTAKNGSWIPGPGLDFIRAVQDSLPELDFIAEDLGYVTPEVRQLQLDSGYPGMKVIEFAFDSREAGNYLPHLYPVNSVCYTGTHDNTTLKQWFDDASAEDIDTAKAYLGLNEEEGYIWGMIRGGMSSVSRLCVVQMQDYLELGAESRMNHPGTLSPSNWTWRAEPGFASADLADRIYNITVLYDRKRK